MKRTCKLSRSATTAVIVAAITIFILPVEAKKVKTQEISERQYWCQQAWKMAQPVLENMAKGELQKNMQTEFSPSFDNRNRKVVYMETFGRLMAGIAPWLGTAEGTSDLSEAEMVRKLRSHRQAGQPIYETQLWQALMLSSGLTIVPTRNMISNSGVSAESAHFTSSMQTLPRAMQRLMTLPSHDVSFPLRHPKYVMENVEYKERVFRIMAWEHPFIKVSRSMEELWRNLRYGNFRNIASSLRQRVRKLTGRHDYL